MTEQVENPQIQKEVERLIYITKVNELEKDFLELESKVATKFETLEKDLNSLRGIVSIFAGLKKALTGLLIALLGSIAAKLVDLFYK